LLLVGINELLLHFVYEVDAFLDGVHDGITVHLELVLVEIFYHLVQKPILLFYADFGPFVVLKRERTQQLLGQLPGETEMLYITL
jgi:hypothetical protein